MMKNFLNATHYIPVIPLGKTTLPLSQLFSPVVVVKNIESKEISRKKKQPERNPIEKPAEIFFNDKGEPVRRIYMKGEAGRGKTVYGLKLLEEWCKVKQGSQSEMQDVLSQFEFLFHVSMRYVEPDRVKVVDMICDSLSEEDSSLEDLITSVLCNSDIRCLVFLDGLDEWSTKSDYFPKTNGLVNCVLFTTSRPWKLEKLQIDYTSQDRVVEIKGINPESDETLIPRIVTHLYGEDDQGLTNRLISYCKQRVNAFKTRKLMEIPLILTASCYAWCEEETKESEPGNEKDADKSMTYFSLVIIDMLIQRAEKNNKEVKDYLKEYCNEQTEPKSTTNTMTSLLSQYFPKIMDFLDILTPFCKVAYNDLMSKSTNLVFRKDQLEREMGRQTVELALKVGIISQCWAPGRGMNIQNVSVSFFHKLIQELMAAMHIVYNPDLLPTFCHQCDTIDKIFGLSNVIMYLTGLDGELGCQLSQHVGHIALEDKDILQWRETMEPVTDDKAYKVWFLFKSQYEWYNEMVCVRTLMGITDPSQYHVCDVNIPFKDCKLEVAVISEMLRNTNNIVVSVCLNSVPDTCLSNIIMYLPQHSESLTTLYIVEKISQRREHLVTVLFQLKQLKYIRYEGSKNDDDDVVKAVTGLTMLKSVLLHCISVVNTKMSVSNLTQLQYLMLNFVDMTASGWRELLSSLCSIPHSVHVILRYTNINDDNIEYVKSSPLFNLIKHKEGCKNDKTLRLEFYSKTSHQSL